MKDKNCFDPDTANAAITEIINSDPDGKLVVGKDGTILFANTAATQIFEREITSLVGQEFWHPLAPGNKIEISLVKQDSSEAVAEMRVTDTFWNGQPAFLVTITDVTERKNMEQTLRLEEERYREFFMNSPFGYHSLDHEGRVQDVNQAWLDGLGYSREEVIGKWFGEFLSPEQADIFRERFPKFKAAGKTHAEFLMKHKDGSMTLEAIDGKVAYDLGGKFKHTHCVLQDVTEARRAEAAIQQSRQKYQALFESSGDAAFVHQPTAEGLPGVFLEVNQAACALLGYTKEELLKLGPRDIVVWEKAGVAPPDIMKRLETDKKVTQESAFRHKDGHEIPIEVVIHRFELQGKPAVLTLARDITVRKKAEVEQLDRQVLLRKILDNSLELIGCHTEKIDYKNLTDLMVAICGAKYGAFNLFDDNGKGFTTVAVSGVGDKQSLINSTLGINLINKKWKFDSVRAERTKDSTVTRFDSIHDLSYTVLPKKAVQELERAFGVGDVFVVKITRDGVTIGDFTLLFAEGTTLQNQELAEVFANNIGLYIGRKEAEAKLARTKEQLSKAELFAGFGHWEINLTDKSVKASRGARNLYGVGSRKLELTDIKKFPLSDYRKNLDKSLEELVKENKTYDVEFKIKRVTDGQILDIYSTAEYDNASNTVFGVIQDITKRKTAEEELYRQAAELKDRNLFIQSIIDNLPIGLAINNIGDGKATYHNQKFEEIYGWPKKEIIDISTFFEKVYPDLDYRQAIVSRVMADIESGDPARMQWDDIEITTKSGDKRHISAVNIPIFDQGIMVSTVRDVTAQKKAEKELIHTRDLMRYVIEHNTSGVAIHDKDLNYMYVSQRYLDEYKLTQQEIIGRHHYEVFPDLPDKWKLVHQRVLAGEVVSANEDPYLRDDGSMEWTRWECRPWYQLDGAVGGLIVYTEVITGRVQEQQTLRESEEKYRLLAENTESISWEYDVVIDRWTYVAPQVQRIMGYKPEDWTDLKFWTDHVHEDDREWAFLYCMECAKAGKPHVFEYRFIKKDGSFIWLRDVVSVEMKEDNPVKLRGIMFDVTGHKQMEQSLAEAAEEWRTTFDSITDMVAIVDRHHKIARLNTAFAKVLGKSPGELIGEPCYRVIHGMNQPHPMCPHARTLETRQVESSEYFDKKLKKWVEASSSPIFDDQGNLTGSVHIIKDISDRKEAELKEQQLRDKAEMSSRLAAVGEMASGIAHEINNPLTGVIGFSELLLGRPDIPEDMKAELKIINDGSQRVKDIVRRMLTFARQSKPVKSSVSIEELLDNTLELRSYVLKTANIEVVRDYAPDLPWVTADAGQLQQVFLNIIVNAEHAMKKAHDKGVLVVKTEKYDSHIRVLITDDGPGMTDEVKNKLFQPFFTTKDPGEGTGLGLALSMGIIQEHDGSISVNTVVGNGTTFIVELPMTPAETESVVQNPKTEPIGAAKRAKILVVDDERSVGTLIRVIMTRQGHEVQECYGPQEALDKLADNTYDVIILDIRMPGMSGIELLDEIKGRWPEMVSRVLFITGDTSDLSTRTYLNTHNIPYISKPFERLELEEKVNALL